MKTFDYANLNLQDPTNISWALAWARLIAQDRPVDDVYPQFSLEDEEWIAYLTLTSTEVDGTSYYLPHEAVASKIETDVNYSKSLNFRGVSQEYRDPDELARHIRNTYGASLGRFYPEAPSDNLLELTVGF